MNETILNYIGDVNVKIIAGDKVLTVEKHNAGLPLLKKIICKYLTGNYSGNYEVPQFLDLRYNANPELPDDQKTWTSYLTTDISLTGKVYEYSSKYSNWIAKFNATINHNNLIGDITESDPGEFKLVLVSGYNSNEPKESYQELAELPIEAYVLARITPGTQAIVEWVMQIKNA